MVRIPREVILAMFMLLSVGPSLICSHNSIGMLNNTQEAASACICHLVDTIVLNLAVQNVLNLYFLQLFELIVALIF